MLSKKENNGQMSVRKHIKKLLFLKTAMTYGRLLQLSTKNKQQSFCFNIKYEICYQKSLKSVIKGLINNIIDRRKTCNSKKSMNSS